MKSNINYLKILFSFHIAFAILLIVLLFPTCLEEANATTDFELSDSNKTLTYSGFYDDARIVVHCPKGVDSVSLSVKSSNPSIVQAEFVSEYYFGLDEGNPNNWNKYIDLTRIKTGSAQIIVTDEKSGTTKKCNVNVLPPDWCPSITKISLPAIKNETENVILSGYETYAVSQAYSSNDDIVYADVYKDGYYDTVFLRAEGAVGNAVITIVDVDGIKKYINVNCYPPEWKLDKYNITIPYDQKKEVVYSTNNYDYIKTVKSSNKKVVNAKFDEDYNIVIYKKGFGKAKVMVTDKVNRTQTINVYCPPKPFSLNRKKIIFKNYANDEGRYRVNEDIYADYDIKKVISHNNKIIKVVKNHKSLIIKPVKPGKTTVEFIDKFGRHKTVKAYVSKNYFKNMLKQKTYIETPLAYGEKKLWGWTLHNCKVIVKIGKGMYVTKTSNSKGSFKVSIPIKKIGTKVAVIIRDKKRKNVYKEFDKISKPDIKIKAPVRIYRNSKRVKIKVSKLHKGDLICMKVGRHFVKKKIKNDTKKKSYKFNINYYKKEGGKLRFNIKNKFGQYLKKKRIPIYYSTKLKKGMTKRQCKYVPGWEYPDNITHSNNITIWWYDDNDNGLALDSYLVFSNGILQKWYIR